MKILLTGVTGYIGARLLPKLVHAGHDIVALARSKERVVVPPSIRDHVQVVEGDLLDRTSLPLIESCDVAYYLVHSLTHKGDDFGQLEQECAHNFLNWVNKSGCRQIVYLSGVSDDTHLSPHLASRQKVANILRSSTVPCTVLRAAVIVGSGSASFEIIRSLVEKLPFMVAPKWVSSQCQPIAIVNVIDYLASVINHNECLGKTFDIGGPDVLTYKQMLMEFARVRGLKRYILSVPVLTPRLSSYWLVFVTPVNFSLSRALVESLKNNAVCGDNNLAKVIPLHLISYTESVQRAFAKIQANSVVSSWKDSLGSANLSDFIQVPENGCMQDFKAVSFKGDPAAVQHRLWNIGGDTGWYSLNWAWKVRGVIDKIFGGVGLRRGRTRRHGLKTGDAIDFWRVLLADQENGRLLLYAEMKLPGEAWLEFEIKHNVLYQRATFRPRGLMGRLYWYAMLPFHYFIFADMAKVIAHGTD